MQGSLIKAGQVFLPCVCKRTEPRVRKMEYEPRRCKIKAESIAKAVKGVTTVKNQIMVVADK
jgi:hypothetical protein